MYRLGIFTNEQSHVTTYENLMDTFIRLVIYSTLHYINTYITDHFAIAFFE